MRMGNRDEERRLVPGAAKASRSSCGEPSHGSEFLKIRKAKARRVISCTFPETARCTERSTVERVNGHLTDVFGARSLRVRGHIKKLGVPAPTVGRPLEMRSWVFDPSSQRTESTFRSRVPGTHGRLPRQRLQFARNNLLRYFREP